MKKVIFLIASTFLVLSLSSQTHISGNFTVDTQLGPNGNPADNVYIVDDDIIVYGYDGPDYVTTLTIEPGVIIKFAPSTHPYLKIGYPNTPGKIIAQGTAQNPIVFTSASTNPQSGDWKYIYLTSSADNSVLEYVDITYGGLGDRNLRIEGGPYTINGVTIENSQSRGITLSFISDLLNIQNTEILNNGDDGVSIYSQDNDVSVSFTNCTISNNNGYGIYSNIDGSLNISYTTFNGNTTSPLRLYPNQVRGLEWNNVFQNNSYIEIKGDYIDYDSYWPDFFTNYQTYYLIKDDITVKGTDGPDGVTTLEIEAGAELRFDPSTHPYLSIGNSNYPGKLLAGAVKFTSTSPNPIPGDWDGIAFYDDDNQSILTNCDILYGGYGSSSANIEIYSDLTKLEGCIVKYSAHDGLLLYGDIPEIYDCEILENIENGIYMNGSNPYIMDCLIQNNGENGIYIKSDCENSTISNNDITSNTQHGVYLTNIYDGIELTYNYIYDNTGYGVYNNDNNDVDARYVYWGASNGPSGVGPGNGDEITDYVIYDPWLPTPGNYIVLNPNSQNVSSAQGSFEVTVTSNVNWTITESCDWLTCDPTSGTNNGTFTVNYNENSGTTTRTCEITISGENVTESIIITQDFYTSVDKAIIDNIEIYPNPTKGVVKIKTLNSTNIIFNIKVFDYTGRAVLSNNLLEINKAELQGINLSFLPKGIYYLKITDLINNNTYQTKIVKY
jgi:hypothetical protein